MIGHRKVSRAYWYRMGGFSEPRCARVTRGRSWAYYWRCD